MYTSPIGQTEGRGTRYLYQGKDGWPVGVIKPSTGDIGPFKVAPSKVDALKDRYWVRLRTHSRGQGRTVGFIARSRP